MENLVALAKKAGQYALERQPAERDGDDADDAYVQEKAATSSVDDAVQRMILEHVRQHHPAMGIVAEEIDVSGFPHTNAFPPGKETLILDPIDGTWNYIHGRPYWGVSLAVARGTRLEFGVIHYPALDVLLTTRRGEGTYLNGERVMLEDTAYNPSHMVRVSGAHPDKEQLRAKYPRGEDMRSFVCKLLAILQTHGGLEPIRTQHAYIGSHTLVHDLGCAQLAWEEAGGVVLDSKGEPIELLAHTADTDEGLIVTEEFTIIPSKEYARSLR